MKNLVVVVAAVSAMWAHADAYPSKSISIVVPFASRVAPPTAGARDLAEALRKPLGGATAGVTTQRVPVVPLGPNKVARAAPLMATPCCCTTSAWPPCPHWCEISRSRSRAILNIWGTVSHVPI